jgi:hypothetical protein
MIIVQLLQLPLMPHICLALLGATGPPLLLKLPRPHDRGGLGHHPPKLLHHHHPHPCPLPHPRQHRRLARRRLRSGHPFQGSAASHGEAPVRLYGAGQAATGEEKGEGCLVVIIVQLLQLPLMPHICLVVLGATGPPLLLLLPRPHDRGGLGPHPPQLLCHHHPHPRHLPQPRQHRHLARRRLCSGRPLEAPLLHMEKLLFGFMGLGKLPRVKKKAKVS